MQSYALTTAVLALAAATAAAQSPRPVVQQLDTNGLGLPANSGATEVVVSGDGNVVAFTSSASNLVPDDTNGVADVFVRDMRTNAFARVSVTHDGQQLAWPSGRPALNYDGRWVAFESAAPNLVPDDTNGTGDIFLCDRTTGRVQRASVGTGDVQAQSLCCDASVSADGRFVAFASDAPNLGAPATVLGPQIYLRDLWTGETRWISQPIVCDPTGGECSQPAISGDGKTVVFLARYFGFTVGVPPTKNQVWKYHVPTGLVELVSRDAWGNGSWEDCFEPCLSADGTRIAFSTAAALVPEDRNGQMDVYFRDRNEEGVERGSITTWEAEVMAPSYAPSLSPDGRYLAFTTIGGRMAPVTPAAAGVFVRDLLNGVTQVASVNAAGEAADGPSFVVSRHALSLKGRFLVYLSAATNLVDGLQAPGLSAFGFDRRTGGPHLDLIKPEHPVSGLRLVLKVENATPGGIFLLGVSLNGQGPTPTPWGLVDVGLPVDFYPAVADGAGTIDYHMVVFPGLDGLPVMAQGFDVASGRISDSLAEIFE